MHALTLPRPSNSRSVRAWRVAVWVSAFLAFVLLIALSRPAHAGPLSYTQGTQVNNVDTNPATTDTITIPAVDTGGSEIITDIDVTVTIGNTANGGGGPFTSDLQLTLVHPGGTSVQLKPLTGASTNPVGGNVTWTFDDEAATTITATSGPGTFRPSTGTLSTLDTFGTAGTWTLQILDTVVPGEADFLVSWSINIEAIPEPGTGALFGVATLGLVGMVGNRRRRRRVSQAGSSQRSAARR